MSSSNSIRPRAFQHKDRISWDDIKNYYNRNSIVSHQTQMYESGDLAYHWWQSMRKEIILKMISNHRNITSVLDVGCAEGGYLDLKRRDVLTVGCDLSMAKLRRAQQRNTSSSPDYVLADASHLPFRERSFDLVICVDVIRYLPDPFSCVCELFKLSHGSLIVQSLTDFLNLSSHPRRRSESDVRKEFSGKEFSGAFWVFSPRAIENLKQMDTSRRFRTAQYIGLLPLANVFRIARIKDKYFRRFIPIISKIQNQLGSSFPFYLMGLFSTIEFGVE